MVIIKSLPTYDITQDGSSVICNKVTYSDNGVVVFSTDQDIQLAEGEDHEYSSIPAISDQLPEMLLSSDGRLSPSFTYRTVDTLGATQFFVEGFTGELCGNLACRCTANMT